MNAYQQPYMPPPPPPRRKRPKRRWWFISVGLIVLAPIVFVGALFTVLGPLMREDAVFSVADTPTTVDLPAGEERGLYVDPLDLVTCTATDAAGQPVELRSVAGDFTVNEWTAVARFDTGDGDVTFECMSSTADAEVRVGQVPSTGGFVAGILIGIIGPLLLGGIGFVMLIIVAVLYATGAPREPQQPTP